MTIREILSRAGKYLKERNIEDPSKEAGLLLSWLLDKDFGYLYAHDDRDLDGFEAERFWNLIERRGNHEPYAYITGRCEFMSIPFEVNPHVLIPRPDTEVLAEAAIYFLGKQEYFRPEFRSLYTLPPKPSYTGLDLGTGSGCLAVSIAKLAGNIFFDAVDISRDALETARRNAALNKVDKRINFIESDFLSDSFSSGRKYDIIVSNPPYIPEGDIPSLMASVRNFEPYGALAGGEDGLVFYREIARKAPILLETLGIIAVECGFDQADQVKQIFEKNNFACAVLKDFSGINRTVIARYKV